MNPYIEKRLRDFLSVRGWSKDLINKYITLDYIQEYIDEKLIKLGLNDESIEFINKTNIKIAKSFSNPKYLNDNYDKIMEIIDEYERLYKRKFKIYQNWKQAANRVEMYEEDGHVIVLV